MSGKFSIRSTPALTHTVQEAFIDLSVSIFALQHSPLTILGEVVTRI